MSHASLIGQQAPSFTLTNYNGEDLTVKPGESGLPIILFFYPNSGVLRIRYMYTWSLTIHRIVWMYKGGLPIPGRYRW